MPANHARNVALTPELNAFVDHLVTSGSYANASEVMRAGLRALKHSHSMDETNTCISTALDQLDRGDGITGDPRQVLNTVLDTAKLRNMG